jgi:hypothetical protein
MLADDHLAIDKARRIGAIEAKVEALKAELAKTTYIFDAMIDACIPCPETIDVKHVDRLLVPKLNELVGILKGDQNFERHEGIAAKFAQMKALDSRYFRCREGAFGEIKSEIKSLYMDYNNDFRLQEEAKTRSCLIIGIVATGLAVVSAFCLWNKFSESHSGPAIHQRSSGFDFNR